MGSPMGMRSISAISSRHERRVNVLFVIACSVVIQSAQPHWIADLDGDFRHPVLCALTQLVNALRYR